MRGERERRLCFFFFYTRQSCEAMKPPIDKRGLIRGSSGERKVSEVRPHNSRRIHRLLAAKTEPRFLYFSFPFHPLTADPSLFCLLLPVLRLLPLLLSRAAEGFAPSELRCYLNYANMEKKKMQSCILFVNFLAGENIYIRDLEMHLLNKVREEQLVLPLKKTAAQSKTESLTCRGARG